jgi:hypothetical protein
MEMMMSRDKIKKIFKHWLKIVERIWLVLVGLIMLTVGIGFFVGGWLDPTFVTGKDWFNFLCAPLHIIVGGVVIYYAFRKER